MSKVLRSLALSSSGIEARTEQLLPTRLDPAVAHAVCVGPQLAFHYLTDLRQLSTYKLLRIVLITSALAQC